MFERMSNFINDLEVRRFAGEFLTQRPRGLRIRKIIDGMTRCDTRQKGMPRGRWVLFEISERRVYDII
jgi:hypothetical protein